MYHLFIIYFCRSTFGKKPGDNNQLFKLTSLAINCCDCEMGVHLMIISIKDFITRKGYVQEDHSWRRSSVCITITGFSFFTIIMSTFLMILKSLSRFLVTKHPLEIMLTIRKFRSLILLSIGTSLVLPLYAIYNVFYSRNVRSLTSPLCTLLGC